MGDRFSLLFSPAMINCRLDPYFAIKMLYLSAMCSNNSFFLCRFRALVVKRTDCNLLDFVPRVSNIGGD